MLTRRKMLGIIAGLPLLGGLFGKKEEKWRMEVEGVRTGRDEVLDRALNMESLRLLGQQTAGKHNWSILIEWGQSGKGYYYNEWCKVRKTDLPDAVKLTHALQRPFYAIDSRGIRKRFKITFLVACRPWRGRFGDHGLEPKDGRWVFRPKLVL